MNNTIEKQITEWSEKEFVYNRHQIWFGTDMPKTISAKELIDNGLDQIADKKSKAKNVYIKLTRNSVIVIDDGNGISLSRDTSNGQTHLMLAVHKLFTSTNYEGTDGLTGNNGVGATASNFLSKEFIAGHLDKDNNITGYIFNNGDHHNNGETEDILESNIKTFDSNINSGFYVSANYSYEVLDEDINIEWLLDYIKYRTGELPKNSNVIVEYNNKPLKLKEKLLLGSLKAKEKLESLKESKNIENIDLENLEDTFENEEDLLSQLENNLNEENEESNKDLEKIVKNDKLIFDRIEYSKKENSKNYINSWEENCIKNELTIIKQRDGWKFAFGKEIEQTENMKSIIQGAPVNNSQSFNAVFQFADFKSSIKIPTSFYYAGKKAPNYTDQTKVRVKMQNAILLNSLKKTDLYKYFNMRAEELFLEKQLKNNESNAYTPATGNGYKELIIAEGYSAISGIKAVRNPKTQACFFIIGVILNTYMKDLNGALKSPVVKELLTVLQKERFDKIIVAVDADIHGSHIFTLVMGLLYKFQNHILRDGRLFYLNSPFYIFTKGKEFKWSDNKEDCPKGWHIKTNKGLGGLTDKETKQFITNPETRELWRINIDKNTEDSLYLSMKECGARWVIE